MSRTLGYFLLAAAAVALSKAEPSSEALKIVLREQNEHKGIETHYIKESERLDSVIQGSADEARHEIELAAEKKQVVTLAIELRECKKLKGGEALVQRCMQRVRDKALGPMPQMNSTKDPLSIKRKGAAETEAVLSAKESHDPKVMERILQMYATKMETFNLLRGELDLVQGIAKLSTGEVVDGQAAANVEVNALVINSNKQARDVLIQMVRLGLRPPAELLPTKENPRANPKLTMNPMSISPPEPTPPPKTTTAPPSEWDIYRQKLHHAAYVDEKGLGPNNWNPTSGRKMINEKVNDVHV